MLRRSKQKVISISQSERSRLLDFLDIEVYFENENFLIDPSRIKDSDLKYLLPGQVVVLEYNEGRLRALYRPGHKEPLYFTSR